jgi:hypothetical protein
MTTSKGKKYYTPIFPVYFYSCIYQETDIVTTWLQSWKKARFGESKQKLVLRGTENGGTGESRRVARIWCHKFYDPNHLEKKEPKLIVCLNKLNRE